MSKKAATYRPLRYFEVTVYVDGEPILTIGSHHLAGVPNASDYDDEIRAAAQHLLGFIGEGYLQ